MLKQITINTNIGWIIRFALLGAVLVVCCLFAWAPIKVAAQEAEPCTPSQSADQAEAESGTTEACPQESVDPQTEEPPVVVVVPIISDNTEEPANPSEKFTPDRSENTGDYSTPIIPEEPAPAVEAVAAAESTPPPPAPRRRVTRRPTAPQPNDVPAVAGATTSRPTIPNQPAPGTVFGSSALPATDMPYAGNVGFSATHWLGAFLLVIGSSTAIGLYFRPQSSRDTDS